MKKILFILPSLGVGGLERVQVTLANKLVQHGYDVTVMILAPVDDLKSELNECVHFVYKPPKQHLGNRVPYIRHKLYDDGMWETRASAKQLYDYYVGDEKYDIEIAFFRGMPIKILSGSPSSRKKPTTISKKSVGAHVGDVNNTDFDSEIVGRRSLAWVHNDFERATGYRNNFNNMKEVFEAYASYDYVVCVSKQAAEGFKKTIGDTGNITTIYNILPVENIRKLADEGSQLHIKKAKLHLVIVARLLDSAKGQVRLINAVCHLHDEGAEISLAIVGGGSDYRRLQQLISDRHAESYIELVGEKRNPYPYIKEADVLVCASYFEGFNLTVAEALILGVPVLSTDCTGPNEILDQGKYGMIVENSEEGLYNGLRQLEKSPDLLWNYRIKAQQRETFFDEDRILKQIYSLIN
jgi:glycosyltransferase involved in cell wall biosynthesis